MHSVQAQTLFKGRLDSQLPELPAGPAQLRRVAVVHSGAGRCWREVRQLHSGAGRCWREVRQLQAGGVLLQREVRRRNQLQRRS